MFRLYDPTIPIVSFCPIGILGIINFDIPRSRKKKIKPKIKKKNIDVYKCKKDKEILVSVLEDKEIVSRLNKAAEIRADVSGYVVRAADKSLTMIIKSSIPVFRGEKQDIRPYIKKGLDDIDFEDEESGEEETIEE